MTENTYCNQCNSHSTTNPFLMNNSGQHGNRKMPELNDECVSADNAFHSYEAIAEIADYFLKSTRIRPKIGIICGSGLNSLANHLTDKDEFPYETVPHFPISTVEGHVGQMVFGHLGDVPVMCMQGRFHYYEGYPLSKCSIPIRVMKLVGVKYLLATNAAGGLNPKFKIGDIMLIKDHINLMGITGHSPLLGPNESRFGPRFLSMVGAYDRKLIKTAKSIAKEMNIEQNIHEGVFTCMGGPNYETIAEIRMLRSLGIDAVGMSTVHEIMTAKHCDMKAFAFSLITNCCQLEYDESDEEENNMTKHEEVVEVGRSQEKICAEFMKRMVKAISILEVENK